MALIIIIIIMCTDQVCSDWLTDFNIIFDSICRRSRLQCILIGVQDYNQVLKWKSKYNFVLNNIFFSF